MSLVSSVWYNAMHRMLNKKQQDSSVHVWWQDTERGETCSVDVQILWECKWALYWVCGTTPCSTKTSKTPAFKSGDTMQGEVGGGGGEDLFSRGTDFVTANDTCVVWHDEITCWKDCAWLLFFVLGVLSYLTPLLPTLTLTLTLVRVVETVFVLLQSKWLL